MKKNLPQNLLIMAGFSCNNNCMICSVGTKKQPCPDRPTREIIADLKKGRQDGFKRVEFTGGEPSVRRDIVKLVKIAKDLGYQQIALTTNGRLFSYEKFCREIVATGLNKVIFSLLGSDKKIHEAITRTPGSFNQIIQGIKNIQRFKKVKIIVSSVICRLNINYLISLGKLIKSLEIKNWYLLDLIPDGYAKIFYNNLLIKLPTLSNKLNTLKKISTGFQKIVFFDFPFCLFSPIFKKTKKIYWINAKGRSEISQQIGYNPKRIEGDARGNFSDVYKEKVAFCRRCRYHKECGGLWQEYLARFGDEELATLARKNKCLKNG